MAGLQLGGVFVEGGLGVGVIFQHFFEAGQVFEQVWVGQMAAGEVAQERGETDVGGCWDEGSRAGG